MDVGTRVVVIPVGCHGVIVSRHFDENGKAVSTVKLDNPSITPDGHYLCRDYEMLTEDRVERHS